jgi:hypothetical protein
LVETFEWKTRRLSMAVSMSTFRIFPKLLVFRFNE